MDASCVSLVLRALLTTQNSPMKGLVTSLLPLLLSPRCNFHSLLPRLPPESVRSDSTASSSSSSSPPPLPSPPEARLLDRVHGKPLRPACTLVSKGVCVEERVGGGGQKCRKKKQQQNKLKLIAGEGGWGRKVERIKTCGGRKAKDRFVSGRVVAVWVGAGVGDDWLGIRDKRRECEETGCGDMKHPRAIFLCLTSLTVGKGGEKRRREVAFYAVNFAAA